MFLRRLLFTIATLLLCDQGWGLCVSANQANLRSGPSVSSKHLWTVGKYMPLLAVKQKGSWIQVKDLEGKKFWVAQSLVSDDFDCAVIRVGKSSLRKGPGKTFGLSPLSYAYKYAPFRKLDRDGAWLLLKDDYGFKHWVFEKNLWEPLEYTNISY